VLSSKKLASILYRNAETHIYSLRAPEKKMTPSFLLVLLLVGEHGIVRKQEGFGVKHWMYCIEPSGNINRVQDLAASHLLDTHGNTGLQYP
jgi:hypothetical protein